MGTHLLWSFELLIQEGTVQCFKSVSRLVGEQAAIQPGAVAVSTDEGRLTYKQLHERSSQLADYLARDAIPAGAPIALCIPSSIAMVVGALGILKAGAPYLPLDPSYPAQRLSYILNDAKTPIVVTTSSLAEQLSSPDRRVISLDDDGLAELSPSANSIETDSQPSDSAYVIYTSGSTGQPKGVEITHANLLNLVRWHINAFNVTPADRATQLSGVGFDAAVWEIWPHLAAGASLHIPDKTTRTDAESLRDWLLAKAITITFIPTALAERMMKLDWPAGSALRTVLTGADLLHEYPPAKLPFVLVNNYGPTECTVVATSGIVSPHDNVLDRPPIGTAIANTRVYILAENLKEAGPGCAGELHIGGAGVGRGYLHRPALTAEKFIPDPFSSNPGARIYKTGDLAKYLPDGRIQFLGRMDDQIKIRGFRIEPNEIVSVLNRHESILESAVVALAAACATENNVRQLVAYIVPSNGARPSYSGLQQYLRSHLPDYMIPPVFVLMERLPLTPHGKIDRTALPEPAADNTLADDSFKKPWTATQQSVAELLMSLLHVDRIGMNDNFFYLGGHSLLGAQVIARIRDTFGVDLSLRVLFDHPTIEGIAAEVERQGGAQSILTSA
jgi:amino acid adenylation domain-containing protein